MTLSKKLFFSVFFNLSITLAELIGGLISGSLALLSDSLHNATDTISLVFAYIAHVISKKRGDEVFTYGYKRAEIVGALTNSVFMVIVSIFLMFEGIGRLLEPEVINLDVMLPVAIVGLLGNLLTIIFLHGEHGLNVRAAFFHILSDLFSSVLVIVAGFIMKYLGILWPDPVFTMAISVYLFTMGLKVFFESSRILMQAAPKGWDSRKVHDILMDLDFVKEVHHVHVWTPDGEKVYAELHVVLDPSFDKLVAFKKIHERLKSSGIDHVTVQLEERGYHEEMDEIEHSFEEEEKHFHDHG